MNNDFIVMDTERLQSLVERACNCQPRDHCTERWGFNWTKLFEQVPQDEDRVKCIVEERVREYVGECYDVNFYTTEPRSWSIRVLFKDLGYLREHYIVVRGQEMRYGCHYIELSDDYNLETKRTIDTGYKRGRFTWMN